MNTCLRTSSSAHITLLVLTLLALTTGAILYAANVAQMAVCMRMLTYKFQMTHAFTRFDHGGFERQGRSLCCKRGMHGVVCKHVLTR